MRITYDPTADAAYIYLREIEDGGVANTIPVDSTEGVSAGDVNLDFDAEGRLIGIEVLGARSTLPREALDEWRRGG
jgi:uncharacterized protein YuzE